MYIFVIVLYKFLNFKNYIIFPLFSFFGPSTEISFILSFRIIFFNIIE